jgi:hypothetical protein
MRTATFGDRQVIRTLQHDFVLLWHNQHAGEGLTGQQAAPTDEQVRAYPEGAGGTNVITYVADPTGKTVYKLTGFWRPERYLSELKFGRELAGKVSAEQEKKVKEVLAADHKLRARAVADDREVLARKHPEEFKRPVRESDVRKKDAALGLLEQSINDSVAVGPQHLKELMQVRFLRMLK